MRINRVSVTELFGIFDHDIPLNVEDRITIVHGPNGSGKTVILAMLDGLFNSKYSIFRRIPFARFRVDLDDGRTLSVERASSPSRKGDAAHKVLVRGPDPESQVLDITTPTRRRVPPRGMTEVIEGAPELEQVGYRQWVNTTTGQLLSLEEVLEDYASPEGPPPWLREVQEALPVRCIRTERLATRSMRPRPSRILGRGRVSTPAVVEYSQNLVRTIEGALARSVDLSSALDSSFPARLMERCDGSLEPDLTEEELRQKLRELEEKRSRLTEAGLLDRGEPTVQIPEGEVDPVASSVLSIYVRDAREKLQAFDEILDKIELMQELINTRFLYKRLTVSKEEGFAFRTPDGSILAPEALSSGEQHQVALLYELLFKVQPSSLILIDEPEISLHIAWQHEFLNDLARITALSDFDLIIATHSPDIVSDRWDLTVELTGPEDLL